MTDTIQTLNSRLGTLLERRPVIMQLLRFAAIGALNTALDFIIFNFLSKYLGVTMGSQLGMLGTVGFSAAILQSYLWNRSWAFDTAKVAPLQNAYRLVMVGGLGFISFLSVVIGAAKGAPPVFYLVILFGFIIIEFALWMMFELKLQISRNQAAVQFIVFLIISAIGLLINSTIVSVASTMLAPSLISMVNVDTIKNVAKALATGISLIWNFIGYKIFVFKK